MTQIQGLEQLLDLKSSLEQNIVQLNEEFEILKSKIALKREDKKHVHAKKAEDAQRLIQLRVSQLGLNAEAQMYHAYVAGINDLATEVDLKVKNQVQIKDFEEKVMQHINSFDGAMEFFREDSLQMELMKKANNVREQRVEFTRVENEHKQMQRMIEERKREKERNKLAEQQRLRELEEKEKRERFLKSRANFKKSQSPSPPANQRQDPPPPPPPVPRQEVKLPEIIGGSLSQFMRW